MNVTTFISLFSFYSPIPSTMRDFFQTRISPDIVPVTAISVPGIKIVLVNGASDYSLLAKSFFSILGE